MKKLKNKQGIRASKLAKNAKIKQNVINVQNTAGAENTIAEIVVENHLDYTPKISVIIPVYNVEEYLCQCLESVIKQTLREIEIICIDDGSTDNSLKILQEYAQKDRRITVLKQENLHAGVARNAGLAVAKGEYIHFLDSDDWIDEETYAKLYDLITTTQADFVKFKSYTYDNKEQEVVNSYFTNMGAVAEKYFDNFYNLQDDYKLLLNVSDAPWSGIYNHQFLKKNRILFDNLLCANDVSFFYRCLVAARKIYLSKQRFVYYRIHNSSSLIGIRAYNFDCQLRQFMITQDIIKNLAPAAQKEFCKHLACSIFYRYAKYIGNPQLETEAKVKIRQEMREFLPQISQDDVPVTHLQYYAELRYQIAVSVIMPVYNAEQYLSKSLESVMKQTLKNIEIICVNDASTDNSLKILREYAQKDPRIIIINNPQNTGSPGMVKNIGMKEAKGNYIGFVDADDYVDLNYFETLYNLALKNNADIAATLTIEHINNGVGAVKTIVCDGNILITPEQKSALMQYSGSNCTKIYRNSFIKENGIKCCTVRNVAEDNYFSMTAMCLANKIVTTLDTKYYYWHHEHSVTAEKRTDKDFYIFDIYKNIDSFLKNKINDADLCSRYLKAVNKRKSVDFMWFNDALHLNYVDAFKQQLQQNFPEIYKAVIRQPIIISLTSYPGRIKTVEQTIVTLLKQSLRPDKVILWLAPEQFPHKEKDLPKSLLQLCELGLTIDWYHDIGSYKKLIPTLRKYPEAIIVTADDDLLYDKDWLRCLYNSYKKEPQYIHCHRITRLSCFNDTFKIVSRNFYTDTNGKYWEELCKPSAYNKLSGGAGTLFPPHCFDKDVLAEEKFMTLAPTSDDMWFWLMGLLNGYKVKVAANNQYVLKYVQGTQETSLCRVNDVQNHKIFYRHLHNILSVYHTKLKPYFVQDAADNQKICAKMLRYSQQEIACKLKDWFERVSHQPLNLDNPQTFNEKIQWQKLYDSTPLKTRLADKYLVRDWVEEQIGKKYLIELLGVYDCFEDIDFDKLPNQFVIKCNHGCGYNIIVKDKSQLNLQDVKKKLNRWMCENFAFHSYEMQYKDIEPKIIIEQYLENKNQEELNDYKFYCFNGKVHYVQVISDRVNRTHKVSFYDTEWNKQDWWDNIFYEGYVERPKKFAEMLQLAQKLCKGFSFVRVDLYYLDTDEIYFGEMTFTPGSGTMLWSNEKINKVLGQMIKLPEKAYDIDTAQFYKLPKNYHQKLFNQPEVPISLPADNTQKFILSYKLFNFLPIFTYKQRSFKRVWKLLGLPLWKINKTPDSITKYYIFGIPLVEISNK